MLDRFGIDPERRIAELSGGEAWRVDLARVLVGEPEVLLLDETNHLDLPTIERLEEHLAGRCGALVVVSHDRAFLAAVSRTVWWLDRGRLRVLDQGFGEFEAWSERLLAEEEARLHKLERTIEIETEGRTTASPPDADATRVDCAGCRPCARSAPAGRLRQGG